MRKHLWGPGPSCQSGPRNWRSISREGESALSILHGQVYDYTRVNGDYLPFRHFLAQWLGQERHVVFYNLGLGLEFGDAAGENAFRQALEPQENPAAGTTKPKTSPGSGPGP